MADENDIYFHMPMIPSFTAEQNEFIELRVDGPICTQLSRNYFRLLVGVNVLFSSDNETNYQSSSIFAGLIASYFSEICLLDDDDIVVGRLLPNNDIVINDFGIVKNTKIKQGSIEAVYEIRLQG